MPPLFSSYNYSPISTDLYSINNRIALSLCTDVDNELWIGTDGSGISVFRKGSVLILMTKKRKSDP